MADTPMMRQYEEAKRACPDALLLFRMGDFYELFHDDAKTASAVLGLTLTSREKGENAIPMAGFPHHQLESYLGKLIAAGFRAAVCEQVEDPKKAKGLVRREVTRVVTPGTVTDDALLDPRESNYLAAVAPPTSEAWWGLAWIELSTGRFWAAAVVADELAEHLARICPAECLAPEDGSPPPALLVRPMMVTKRPPWAFSRDAARMTLRKQFGTAGLEGFGFSDDDLRDAQALRAAGAILDYLRETQRTTLEHIERLAPYRRGKTLEIDQAARRSLEITRTMREGKREGSLLAVVDRTTTAMGARLLGEWLAAPSADRETINARHEAVGELVADPKLCSDLREALRGVYDLERLLTRIVTGRATPRDLSAVGRSLRALPGVKAKLAARKSPLLARLESAIDPCAALRARLDAALADDCPLSCRDGGFIREGFHPPLEELRELARGGKQWIARYQAEESRRTGIPNLKVGYNKVFGYYIEITNAHQQKIPAEYIRKQTIKNAERYITPELKEYEEKVLSADERAKEMEYELFLALRDAAAEHRRPLQSTAAALAELDVLTGLGELARQRSYCRPEMVDEPILRVDEGRHPVLDALLAAGEFVPNDCRCGGEDGKVLLITGPNMAGKSTYIRQAALMAVMAQIGSFVPARKAVFGTVDRLFARVGAGDEIARGQSTFMVEMTETARILNLATERSLVVLDEIGRGTSTYDGISLAWAVVEHLHDRIGCRTLFATHYHELTDLEKSLSGVRNYNVAVREWQDNVVFLHKIVPGAADKSYGIHVARLAGVPKSVIERSKDILVRLEQEHLDSAGRAKIARSAETERPARIQLTLFGAEHPMVEELRSLDVDSLTPLAALQRLHQWKEQLRRR